MSPKRIEEIKKSVGELQAISWLGGRLRVYEFMLICDLALVAMRAESGSAVELEREAAP